MPHVTANGIRIEYESRGDEKAETILLIMGLGAQMTRWSAEFVDRFVQRGYRVVRFDNRDVGLSERLESAGAPDIPGIVAALHAHTPPPAAYTLSDMAADAVGVLDALGIAKAHIVGASMGGMIAQLVAADYPEHTLSLTSIMSTTGHPDLPRATPEAMAVLNVRGPSPVEDMEGFLAHSVVSARTIGSPGFPFDEATVRANSRRDADRSYYPMGFLRQYAGVMASPERRAKLATITAPAVVIHGEADPLVPVTGGRDTAAHIPGADLRIIPGMGHDIPPALYDTIVDGVISAASRSKSKVPA